MDTKRIIGLDSIRAGAALAVLVAHLGGVPVPAFIDQGKTFGHALAVLFSLVVNGQAAVIVFFIISGFCIHLPIARGRTPDWKAYFVRRIVRIGLPMVAVLPFLQWANISFITFHNSIYWSLLCEIIYYCIYPLLLLGRNRWGWWSLIWLSFGVGVLLNLLYPVIGTDKLYQRLGAALTWCLGLPCWLLGAALVEDILQLKQHDVVRRTAKIWFWRLGLIVLPLFANILTFHSPFSHSLTLNLFAFYGFFWIRGELMRFPLPPHWTEWVGKWSYSIYLFHLVAKGWMPVGLWDGWFGLPLGLACVLGSCFLFYLIIEWPSHLLALWLGKKVSLKGSLATCSDRSFQKALQGAPTAPGD